MYSILFRVFVDVSHEYVSLSPVFRHSKFEAIHKVHGINLFMTVVARNFTHVSFSHPPMKKKKYQKKQNETKLSINILSEIRKWMTKWNIYFL